LIAWLRQRPLAMAQQGHVLVHAGLLPQWSAQQALALSEEVAAMLRSDDWVAFLRTMYGNEPAAWRDDLQGADRLRCIINAMTRLRFCTPDGVMDFKMKESGSPPPGSGLLPWFDVPGRRSAGDTIVFGHWSALGLTCRPHDRPRQRLRLGGNFPPCAWRTARCCSELPTFQQHSGRQ
jgi:bis(5'-nucleosyl)-tetraphosphatase (symmetrical)